MISETISLSTPDGISEAYVTRPDEGDHPAVLFYMDAIGLRPQLHVMADRMAAWGYVVLVPNVFYRDGTADELAPTEDLRVPENREKFFGGVMTRVRAYTPDLSMPDAHAYVDRLLTLPGVASGHIGLTGYCMGGALSLRTAGEMPDIVGAAGSFHGGNLATDAADSPHLMATRAAAELYLGHADNDGSMPPERIAKLEAAFDEAGLTYTSELYEDAPHGYTMADSSMYHEPAAERHFRELEALLARTLG
ncbi:dienelactone hydrolase family protein [soil metagenome]